jgi:integrase
MRSRIGSNGGSEVRRYLRRIGHSWYVRVKVPRPLQGAYPGRSHVLVALGTRDLDEAYRVKWKIVDRINEDFRRLRKLLSEGQSIDTPAVQETVTAEDYREQIERARARGDEETAAVVTDLAFERAVHLADKGLPAERAQRYFDVAVDGARTLDRLLDDWLDAADYREQTKKQHRQAYGELREFLGGNALPRHVTDSLALDFVSQKIVASGKSYATQRRKVNSLCAFWKWLGQRKHVPRTDNPWIGHVLKRKDAAPKGRGRKRAYRDDELCTLLGGSPEYPGLRDVVLLGLYSGARLDELCSLQRGNVRDAGDGEYFVAITKSKTKAGIREIAVTHPIACAVLAKRISGEGTADQSIFPEFAPGGYDNKLSWAVSKAFGTYRKARGLTSGETDFHSFRRNVATVLENAGADPVSGARHLGHEFPTMAAAVYSAGASDAIKLRTARLIVYAPDVEAAAAQLAAREIPLGERRGRKRRTSAPVV